MKGIYNKLNNLKENKQRLAGIYKYSGCLAIIILCIIFDFKYNEVMGAVSLVIIIYSVYIGNCSTALITLMFSLFFLTDMSTFFKAEKIASNILLVLTLIIFIILMDYINNSMKKRKLLKRQEFYLQVINNLHNGILVSDYKNILFYNKVFQSMLQISEEDMDYNKKLSYDDICSQLEIEEELKINIDKRKIEFTKKVAKNDKVKLYRFNVIKKVHENKEIVIILIYDVTEKVEYENALLKAKNIYNNLIQSIPNAIVMHNNKKIIFANKSFLNMMRVSSIEELGQVYIDDYIEEEYKLSFYKQIKSVENRIVNDVKKTYLKIRNKENDVIEVEASTVPMPYNNTKMVTVFYDRTEIKQFEAEKKLINEAIKYEKMKLEFFANVSHEFKTPLNMLFTSIQTIELYLNSGIIEDNSGKLKKYLKTMKQNCYRQLRLINNLIDITKLDAGFYDINYKDVNIVEIIENLTLSIVDYADQKGVEVIFDTEYEEIIMAIDEEKIERIILNLLSNAVKFTDDGDQIILKVNRDENHLYISIKDTGIGIKKEEIGIVFDRFKQAQNSTVIKGQGSGIGLSLVKSLVELLDGKIQIKSKEFMGTEFIITLPIRSADSGNIKESYGTVKKNYNIEKINVEFSDIYY